MIDWGNVFLCLLHGDCHKDFAWVMDRTPAELSLALSPPDFTKPLPPFDGVPLTGMDSRINQKWRRRLSARARLHLARDGRVPDHLQPDLTEIHREIAAEEERARQQREEQAAARRNRRPQQPGGDT